MAPYSTRIGILVFIHFFYIYVRIRVCNLYKLGRLKNLVVLKSLFQG